LATKIRLERTLSSVSMINHLLLGACVAVIAVGLGAPVLVSSRGPMTEGEPPQAAASESTTGVGDGTRRDEPAAEAGFLGVVVALQSVDVSARFDGTLERLDVHVGDQVKGGTPIARLDGRSIARDLAIAEAALRVAEAEHDRVGTELEDASGRRARLHLIPELVSREQLAAAESQERMAWARRRGSVADLAGKRARTDQLREMLRDTQIVAPFDGTIAAQYLDSGTTVSRGTPIVRMINPTSLVVRFAVPEEQAAAIAVGREVIVRVASVDLTADSVIESIGPEIDAALRMVVVEARLSANGGRPHTIPAGAIARVLFPDDLNRQAHHPANANPPISSRERSTGYERPID
jgi:RND family efflux transporter MFP subunit